MANANADGQDLSYDYETTIKALKDPPNGDSQDLVEIDTVILGIGSRHIFREQHISLPFAHGQPHARPRQRNGSIVDILFEVFAGFLRH